VAGLPRWVIAAGWGFAGGLFSALAPLIQERRLPRSERVDKDLFWFFVSLVLLPALGAFAATLAFSRCNEIDPIFCAFAGVSAPTLLQKWQQDSLSF
jgi:hypothetical protein